MSTAPIARLAIDQAGACTGAVLYAPGLPPGEHDVYLPAAPTLAEPQGVIPEAQARQAFERWYSDGGQYPRAIERDRNGAYILAQASNAWATWVACWAICQATT